MPKNDKLKHKAHKDSLDYNKITNHVFIGTNACCQVHFREELLQKGINADISLEAERIDKPKGVKFFIWLPVLDHKAPSQDQLKFGVNCIDHLLKLGKIIYLHCKNGHGRAPTMFAAYLIWKKKLTAIEAINFIKKKRKSIHLEDIQIKALKRFEKTIK